LRLNTQLRGSRRFLKGRGCSRSVGFNRIRITPCMAAADRKQCSSAVQKWQGCFVYALRLSEVSPVKSGRWTYTRDRFGRPLPVCCCHGRKRLPSTSCASNSQHSLKRQDPHTVKLSETSRELYMSHHVCKRGWTYITRSNSVKSDAVNSMSKTSRRLCSTKSDCARLQYR